jgi:type VI secretion system protein ImpK
MSVESSVLPTLNIERDALDVLVQDKKIFSTNKLITSASPFIYLLLKLKNKLMPNDINNFRKKLIKEVKIFEDVISSYNFNTKIVLHARYGLCAFADEIIASTPWGKENNWDKNGLLYVCDHENIAFAGKQFFIILKEAIASPRENLDLLEMYYLFLALGFEGKFKGLPRGKDSLGKFTNELYSSISTYRIHFDNTLFQEEFLGEESSEVTGVTKFNSGYLWISICAGLLVILSFYFYLNADLNKMLQQLLANILSITR